MRKQKINVEYLRHVLKVRGISQVKASKAIGRSDNYINKILASGVATLPAIQFFCQTFGVDIDKLIVKDEPKEPEQLSADLEHGGDVIIALERSTARAIAQKLCEVDKKLDFILELMK